MEGGSHDDDSSNDDDDRRIEEVLLSAAIEASLMADAQGGTSRNRVAAPTSRATPTMPSASSRSESGDEDVLLSAVIEASLQMTAQGGAPRDRAVAPPGRAATTTTNTSASSTSESGGGDDERLLDVEDLPPPPPPAAAARAPRAGVTAAQCLRVIEAALEFSSLYDNSSSGTTDTTTRQRRPVVATAPRGEMPPPPAGPSNPKSDDSSECDDDDDDVTVETNVSAECYLLRWLPRYFLQTSILTLLHPSDLGRGALPLCRTTAQLSREVWKGRLAELEEASSRVAPFAAFANREGGELSLSSAVAALFLPPWREASDAVPPATNEDDNRSVRTLKRLYRRRYYLSKQMFEDQFTGHVARVSATALLDDDTFVTASHDGTLRSWKVETGQAIRTFVGHSGEVHGVARLDNDGSYFVSCGGDRMMGKPSARLWDARAGTCLRTFIGHADAVVAVACLDKGARFSDSSGEREGVSNDTPRIVTAGMDASTKIWEAHTGRCVGGCFSGGANDFTSMVTVGRDGLFVTGDSGGGVSVWGATHARRLHHFNPVRELTGRAITAAAAAAAEEAIRTADSQMRVIDCGDGRSVLSFRGRQLKRYNVIRGECIRTYDIHFPIMAMARMDLRLYVCSSPTAYQNIVGIWDIDTGEVVHHFVVEQAVFSLSRLDEVTFVMGYSDGAVELRRIPEAFLVQISDNED